MYVATCNYQKILNLQNVRSFQYFDFFIHVLPKVAFVCIVRFIPLSLNLKFPDTTPCKKGATSKEEAPFARSWSGQANALQSFLKT